MNKKRYQSTLKYLNEKYNPSGWSINDAGWTTYDSKLSRQLNCFQLTHHPHSIAVLVVELNQGEQQQNQTFFENLVLKIRQAHNCSFGNIAYLTFNNNDDIIFELLTKNL